MENDMPAADAFAYNMESFFTSKMMIIASFIAILCGLFLVITFLQSGLNKIKDYQGNKEYLGSVFKETFLKSSVGILLPVILVLELSSGIGILVGIFMKFYSGRSIILALGLMIAAITLVCLLSGQRIAKDYAGAASLTGYFIIAILGLFGCALAW